MGRPKAWLPFGDELMLPRVARILREVVDPIVVVAAPGQDVPPLPEDVAIVRDEVEGKGPLGGLAAGLAALSGKVDAAYLSSCDVPLLKPEFVRRVIELLEEPNPPAPFPKKEAGVQSFSPPLLGEGLKNLTPRPPSLRGKGEKTVGPGEGICIAVPHVGGYHHPLAAAYRIEVLPEVRRLLAADRLRPVFLFESVPTRTIAAAELPDLDSLVNVNTPEEYEAVLRAVTEITTTELD